MRRIKNNKISTDSWVGQDINPGSYYSIQDSEIERWSSDSKVISDIESGNLIVADESEDILEVSHALAFLKGIKRIGISLLTGNENNVINLTNFRVIAVHPWHKGRSYSYKNGILFLEIESISLNETINIRLVDVTNAQVLGSQSITSNGFYEIPISKPNSNAGLELQAKTNNALGISVLKGVRLEFDSE